MFEFISYVCFITSITSIFYNFCPRVGSFDTRNSKTTICLFSPCFISKSRISRSFWVVSLKLMAFTKTVQIFNFKINFSRTCSNLESNYFLKMGFLGAYWGDHVTFDQNAQEVLFPDIWGRIRRVYGYCGRRPLIFDSLWE